MFVPERASYCFDALGTATVHWTETDQHNLILPVIDDRRHRFDQQNIFRWRHVATENGILKRLAKTTHSAMHATKTPRIADVVTDNEPRAHALPRHKRGIGSDFTGKVT